MKMVDARCSACHRERLDFLVRDKGAIAPCDCGGELEIITRETGHSTPHVHGDDIPGGILIHHGICNLDGTPRRYDSKSAMRREAELRGVVNVVRHETDPKTGSDKSKFTQRFVGAPSSLNPEQEAERIAAWHADEAQLRKDGVPTVYTMPEAGTTPGIEFARETSTRRAEIKHIIMKELGKA